MILQAQDPVLLAVRAGSLQMGWAVLAGEAVAGSGILGPARWGKSILPDARLACLMAGLEQVGDRWQPQDMVLVRPTEHRWEAPAMDAAVTALRDWGQRRGLALHCYTSQEVRRAVAGRQRATSTQLAFAVMAMLGAVGQQRAAREWEAIAAGYYHLARQA